MMNWLAFFEKGIWFGLAALGFAILFNAPVRALIHIFLIAALGGLVKTLLLHFGINIILSTLAGAVLIGYVSILAAHDKHTPPMVFAIPSVIPMVPGLFAYRMMLGVIKLSTIPDAEYQQVLADTISNALRASFILLSLALGVAIPLLLSRKGTVKKRKHKRTN